MPASYPPNAKLRAARERNNWTLDDVARKLRALMLGHGETQVGVVYQHVYRWERGTRRPGMRHRHYLCLLYGLEAEELGFLPSNYAEPKLVTTSGQPAPWERSGRNGRPVCAEDELVALNLSRRQLLAASGLLGTSLGVETVTEPAARLVEPMERAARIASGRAAADDAVIADVTAIAGITERAYSRMPAELLIEPVEAHIRLVKALLERPLLPAQREALLSAGSRITARMMMLHFFDQHDHATGRRWLNVCVSMCEEASDPGMYVFGLLQAAQQFVYTSEGDKSVQLMEHARKLAAHTSTPNAMSWIYAVQAEAHATLRNREQCNRLLGLAEEFQSRSRPGYEPQWSERWSRRHVAGFIGAVNMRLEQPGPARAALNEILVSQEASAVKPRSKYLADLAMTYAQEGDVEQACALAETALDIAGPIQYGTTLERMTKLRRQLSQWPEVRAVRELDERLRTVGAV